MNMNKNARMMGRWVDDNIHALNTNIQALNKAVFNRSVQQKSVLNRNVLITGAAIVAAVGAGAACALIWRKMRPNASTFIVEAYSHGLAEISAAELALEKSTSSNVKAFAQHMIEDHTEINKELQTIAERKNIHLSDSTRLSDKTKAYFLKNKEGQSFDEAYLDHQLRSHQHTLALFRRATHSRDTDIRYFAAVTLNRLNSHLKMAQKLLKAVQEYRAIKPVSRKTTTELGNGTNVPVTSRESSPVKHAN